MLRAKSATWVVVATTESRPLSPPPLLDAVDVAPQAAVNATPASATPAASTRPDPLTVISPSPCRVEHENSIQFRLACPPRPGITGSTIETVGALDPGDVQRE